MSSVAINYCDDDYFSRALGKDMEGERQTGVGSIRRGGGHRLPQQGNGDLYFVFGTGV